MTDEVTRNTWDIIGTTAFLVRPTNPEPYSFSLTKPCLKCKEETIRPHFCHQCTLMLTDTQKDKIIRKKSIRKEK